MKEEAIKFIVAVGVIVLIYLLVRDNTPKTTDIFIVGVAAAWISDSVKDITGHIYESIRSKKITD